MAFRAMNCSADSDADDGGPIKVPAAVELRILVDGLCIDRCSCGATHIGRWSLHRPVSVDDDEYTECATLQVWKLVYMSALGYHSMEDCLRCTMLPRWGN